ncbi:MAG: undecaprenyldiphospho-muramoylpentapeptide beta-N-acetylglucosaminyltransferase [candidate division Zixibacteria bacterium]|nr:undecaprenyldiphospho-muramoylpentapeptide beta-N-acetylglucosaminyltransferase [candidate division Zixibacteria bacterium]
MSEVRMIFAGGGTGGHLYPALAIARALEKTLAPRVCNIRFVGSRRGIEFRQRDTLGYPLELMNIRGLPRKLSLKSALFPFLLLGAMIKCNSLLSSFQPHLVVGTGGYVSGPIVRRAAARGILTAVQEQNSYPGLTTRHLAAKVDRVYLGFAEAIKHLPEKAPVMTTGNPIRAEIGAVDRLSACAAFNLDPQKKTILALGGSQGAQSINRAISNGLCDMPESAQLLWQTGALEYEELAGKHGGQGNVRLFAFTEKIAEAYAAADLAISRAGALTVAELKASLTPALLIPYPHATADHQMKNARAVEDKGAAIVIEDEQLAGARIIKRANDILSGAERQTMVKALELWNKELPGRATDVIAADLVRLLEEKGVLS